MNRAIREPTNQNGAPTSFLLKYNGHVLTAVEVFWDGVTIFLSILIGYRIYLTAHVEQALYSNWLLFSAYAFVTALVGIIVFQRFGLYRKQVSLMNLLEIRKIIKAICFLYALFMIFVNIRSIEYPALYITYTAIIILFFTLLQRMLVFKAQQMIHLRGIGVRRVLIIGADARARQLFQNLRNAPKLGFQVVGFLEEDQEILQTTRDWYAEDGINSLFFSSEYEELSHIIDSKSIDEIFVCNHFLGDEPSNLMKTVDFCNSKGIGFSFMPHIRGYYSSQLNITDLGGIPMFSIGTLPLSRSELVSKRIFDLVLATLLLFIFSPLLLLIAVLIRRDSEGPVFFRQMRVGKDGVHFPMYKFRTMYATTPQYGNSPRSSNDPRITEIGRFLRKTSLDELPQLFNVIIGQMSLVGPRPEMPFIVENEYDDLLRERLRIKPGITGVWQISGDRTREIHDNIFYDIFYLENRSFLLDMIILTRTLIFALSAMKTH